jgi:hypothetical protein
MTNRLLDTVGSRVSDNTLFFSSHRRFHDKAGQHRNEHVNAEDFNPSTNQIADSRKDEAEDGGSLDVFVLGLALALCWGISMALPGASLRQG